MSDENISMQIKQGISLFFSLRLCVEILFSVLVAHASLRLNPIILMV